MFRHSRISSKNVLENRKNLAFIKNIFTRKNFWSAKDLNKQPKKLQERPLFALYIENTNNLEQSKTLFSFEPKQERKSNVLKTLECLSYLILEKGVNQSFIVYEY